MCIIWFYFITLLPLIFGFSISTASNTLTTFTPQPKTIRGYNQHSEKTRFVRDVLYSDEIPLNYPQSREASTVDIHDDHSSDEQKSVKDDPWEGYYDFIINEGSFKFWAAFQLVTAALLIYSAFAAVYYAKFNIITTDYDYYDDFYGRDEKGRAASGNLGQWSFWDLGKNGLSLFSTQTFQRIMDAVSTLPSSSSSSKSFQSAKAKSIKMIRRKK